MTSDLQEKDEQASQQIAALTAELRKSQQEKGLIEQRADTLSTALAVRATGSPEVHAFRNHLCLSQVHLARVCLMVHAGALAPSLPLVYYQKHLQPADTV